MSVQISQTMMQISPYAAFTLQNYAWNEQQVLLGVLVQAIAGHVRRYGDFGAAIGMAANLPGFGRFFEFDASDPAKTFRPKQELLFPPVRPMTALHMTLDVRDPDAYFEQLTLQLTTPAMVRMAADTLEWLAGDQADAPPSQEVLDCLAQAGVIGPRTTPTVHSLLQYRRNGIHRLQHASLLYVHEGHSILIDPVLHTLGYGSAEADAQLLAISRTCNAILISHSHADHFAPSSLAFFPRGTPIVVPKVECPNILTPSFLPILSAMGFENVIEADWGELALTIGDIKVRAMPFYGEQPRANGPVRDTRLRNIGNTYLIEAVGDRSWVIVDTGDDVMGKMKDVASQILKQYGPVNHLASNLGKFHASSSNYVCGNGRYWICLTNDDMANFSDLKSECLTLGPRGVAEVITACACESFIPYADWWGEMGSPSTNQHALTNELRQALEELGSPCQIEDVNIGESLFF